MARWAPTRTSRNATRTALVALLAVLAIVVWAAYGALAAPPGPNVSSFTAVGASPTSSSSVSWKVTFSSTVTGVAASNFALVQSGGVAGAGSISVSGSGTTYTVAATTGSGSGTLGLNLTSVGSIKDSSNRSLQGAPYTGPVYTIDRTAPTLSSINRTDANPTKANPLHWTITFNEPVSGVTTSNFALATGNLGGTAPSITTATPTSAAPSATWTVTVATGGTTGTNSGSIGLNLANNTGIKDAAANPLSTPSSTGQAYTFDTATPSATAITRTAGALTRASSVSWTVSFNEPVAGVAATSFTVVQGGGITGTPAVTNVSGSGATWTVTASTGSGTPSSGAAVSLQLNLTSTNGITDSAGNPLAGTLNGSSSAYQVDKFVPPPVLDSTPPDPNSTSTSNFSWHDAEAGVSYLCSTENGAFAATVHSADNTTPTCQSTLTYVVQVTNNGLHQFGVEATDPAGNTSQAVYYSWKVGKGSPQNYVICPSTAPCSISALYPGAAAQPINITFSNPNADTVLVTSLSVAITSITGTGPGPNACSAADYKITNYSGPPFQIPIGASSLSSILGSSSSGTWPTIQMLDRHDAHPGDRTGNQDACQNAVLHLSFDGAS